LLPTSASKKWYSLIVAPLQKTLPFMNDDYDPRRRSASRKERPKRIRSRESRDRSRSRSPDYNGGNNQTSTAANNDAHLVSHEDGLAPPPPISSKDDLEAARRARMDRLRAEMEEEEAKLTQLAAASSRERQIANAKDSIVQVDPAQLEGLDEDEQMKLLLGFSGEFGTTKNQKVDDNHKSSAKGAAAKHKERKYRQYMNRKNGFNRPLEKMD
jgi:U4/U6.U5 tri-snRNP-associated protein 3